MAKQLKSRVRVRARVRTLYKRTLTLQHRDGLSHPYKVQMTILIRLNDFLLHNHIKTMFTLSIQSDLKPSG